MTAGPRTLAFLQPLRPAQIPRANDGSSEKDLGQHPRGHVALPPGVKFKGGQGGNWERTGPVRRQLAMRKESLGKLRG